MRRSRRNAAAVTAGFSAVALLSSAVLALINPKFTPVHLVKQSELILHGALKPTATATDWTFDAKAALKGKPAGAQTLGTANFKDDQRAELQPVMKPDARVMLFASRTPEGDRKAFVHVEGRWLVAKSAGNGKWELLAFDSALDSTYAGGTDMLAKMAQYILDDPDASMPISTGMVFDEWASVGKVEGQVCGMTAVPIGARRCLFVGSPAGDRLFDVTAPKDLTSDVGLDTRSKQFLWLDLDGDGVPDLVSWDGAAVCLRRLKNGKLERADAAGVFKWTESCLGLAAAGASAQGHPRVLLSTLAAPRLLEWSPAGWTASELPKAGDAAALKTSACIVADLNGDGYVDVLQPQEQTGRLWLGTAQGFAEPIASAVKCPGGEAKLALGDFDGDGSLDIFISGPNGNELWENDGRAGFHPVLMHAGSLSYKAEYRATVAIATDLNHDGRPDLALGSADAGFVFHFNRGYRCFGEQGELRLNEVQPVPTLPSWGVQAMAIADFNGNDAFDLAVALAGGEIHCYYSNLTEVAGCRARLVKGQAGPVTVSAWQGANAALCVGAWAVNSSEPVLFSVRQRGKCVLKYALPGKGALTKEVEITEEIPDVVIE